MPDLRSMPPLRPVRRRLRAILPALVALGLAATACSPQPTVSRPAGTVQVTLHPTVVAALTSDLTTGLNGLVQRTSETDLRYFADGRWNRPGEQCMRCDVGPGVAAAALWRVTGATRWRDLAYATFDAAIARHTFPDGSFGYPAQSSAGSDTQTVYAALNLALARHLLVGSNALSGERATRWTAALKAAADWLERNGNLSWYTNGNISLANAAVMGMTWRATGDVRYRTLYDQAFAFAGAPDQVKWPGAGFRFTRAGTAADGADGAGYFTESGPGGVGYDADYTLLQLDIAAAMAVVLGDDRSVRTTNLLLNQLLTTTDRATWQLDTSGGTRHTAQGRRVPFRTGGLAVAVAAGRTDLAEAGAAQAAFTGGVFARADVYADTNMYQGWATQVGPLLAAEYYMAGLRRFLLPPT